MSDNTYSLWCFVQGDNAIFPATVPSTMYIDELKEIVKKQKQDLLGGFDSMTLTLWKVSVGPETVNRKLLDVGQYQLDATDQQQELHPMEKIGDVWPASPPRDHLVYVSLPRPPSGLINRPRLRSLHLVSCLRGNTVSALYERLKRYSFVLVRGTPASGKSTLALLLAHHIVQQDPAVCIIEIFGWPIEVVRRAGGWKPFFHDLGWVQGRKTVFIFDGAQVLYRDSQLWEEFFNKIHDYKDLFIILFEGYGSSTSQVDLDLPNTPFSISDPQRVTLRPVDHRDGLDAVGLLFTRLEFDDFVRQQFRPPSYCFHPSFFDAVFELTGGHVGAIHALVNIVITHDSYRHRGSQLYTCDFFLANVDPRDLFVRLDGSANIFQRGLPVEKDLQDVATARIFSHVLCRGSIVQSHLTIEEDMAALKKCFLNGWLYGDKLSDINNGKEVVYAFPSYLHRWFVEWKMSNTTIPSDSDSDSPVTISTLDSITSKLSQASLDTDHTFSPQNEKPMLDAFNYDF